MASIFQSVLEAQFGFQINNITGISGGDINEARLLETNQGDYFLKFNNITEATAMFEAEERGLQVLAQAKAIRTPEVIGRGRIKDYAFLLLEFIPTESKTESFWETFGKQLANLHGTSTQGQFGFEADNFIGSLAQSNGYHSTWQAFYANERLLPQMQLAIANNLLNTNDLKQIERLINRLPDVCPAEPATLIHGDLWSGNFVAAGGEEAVLIDPSICYAHREMDIAMTQLFGGFERSFYYYYNTIYPLEVGYEQRMEVYQLYYLLVHVNLFGGSYVEAVRRILKIW